MPEPDRSLVLETLDGMARPDFFGQLVVRVQRGRVVHIEKVESILPTNHQPTKENKAHVSRLPLQ